MPVGTQRWGGSWARRWDICTRFSLNSEWHRTALCKIPALNPRTAEHKNVLSIKVVEGISRAVTNCLGGWFLNVYTL